MLRGGLSAALGVLVAIPAVLSAAPISLSMADRDQLAVYARDTWRSLDALAGTGVLPADNLVRTEAGWVPGAYTSPTNIAAYLWSTIAAEDLKLIDREEARERIGKTLLALGRIDRSHGFFYNWYDPKTGDRLTRWPGGGPIKPFLSSVDNGWLAASLMMVANTRPELRAAAEALLAPMNFRFFYDPFDPADPSAHPGLLRGGYYPADGTFTAFHYGMLNTEPRIASYVGIARGDLPAEHYYRMTRGGRGETAPTRHYLQVPVVEGTREYRGMHLVPSWDGTMFEALMVPLFVPEASWAEASWGTNHATYVNAQIEYGMKDADLGFWGVSAASDPEGGYRPFGISALGAAKGSRKSTGVVTPHASFLSLAIAPREAMENLRKLAEAFPIYGEYGFLDSVDVRSGRVSPCVLALDQGMVLAAIANALAGNTLQMAFSAGAIESTIRPLIAPEQFGNAPEILARGEVPPMPSPSAPAAALPTEPGRESRRRRRTTRHREAVV